jgi:hypothetical protein
MDENEARRVLRSQLQPWRKRSWAELRKDVGQSQRFEVAAESGTWYQGDLQVLWDDHPEGAIRVVAAIDDGGWRAFVPMTDDFILAPDGTFVGE